MTAPDPTSTSTNELLLRVLGEVSALNSRLSGLENKVEALSPAPAPSRKSSIPNGTISLSGSGTPISIPASPSQSLPQPQGLSALSTSPPPPAPPAAARHPSASDPTHGGMYSSRVILTTYPGQVGITPVPLNWGARTPEERGPVIASRHKDSIKVRNAVGAYAGSYSIYRALSIASGQLSPDHRPDFTNTEPPVPFPPQAGWFASPAGDPWGKHKIVALDPWGHLAPQLFKESHFDKGLDIRPTIAITRAHIAMGELDVSASLGNLPIDGTVVQRAPHGGGVELNVTKAAVEPVWYLPGVAERFNISEGTLRRALFEDTGGMYPELLTRPDLKTFLPPIGGLTVYIFGPPEYIRDPTKELTLRVHDECNGSDVFGSDICTCRPYLIYGIEEAVRCAQRGGVGVVVYFRKEGRALGEVTKYLVYNARKRGGDSADMYFRRTELIAGVKDMRMQALMPDVLHWLGITKIDNMISMSDMKYDAIVKSGIPIQKRYEIPDDLIPPDSRVEIDAKIVAGYYSGSKTLTAADLAKTVGRSWEDVEH